MKRLFIFFTIALLCFTSNCSANNEKIFLDFIGGYSDTKPEEYYDEQGSLRWRIYPYNDKCGINVVIYDCYYSPWLKTAVHGLKGQVTFLENNISYKFDARRLGIGDIAIKINDKTVLRKGRFNGDFHDWWLSIGGVQPLMRKEKVAAKYGPPTRISRNGNWYLPVTTKSTQEIWEYTFDDDTLNFWVAIGYYDQVVAVGFPINGSADTFDINRPTHSDRAIDAIAEINAHTHDYVLANSYCRDYLFEKTKYARRSDKFESIVHDEKVGLVPVKLINMFIPSDLSQSIIYYYNGDIKGYAVIKTLEDL